MSKEEYIADLEKQLMKCKQQSVKDFDEIEQLQEVRKAARLVVSASTHESAQRHIRRLNDKLIEYDRFVTTKESGK